MIDNVCIGSSTQGVDVFTHAPPNSHQSVQGMSGSGKSTYLRLMENRFANEGAAVVSISCSGSHDIGENDLLPLGVKDRYAIHDVQKEGIPLSMWVQGDSPDNAARRLMSAFETCRQFGSKQMSLLYQGLLNACEHRPVAGDEMSSLLSELKSDCKLAEVSAKLEYTYGFLQVIPQHGIFKPGMITELKVDTDYITNKSVVNFLLALLIFQKKAILPDGEMVLVLDEYQNQDLVHQDAPIPRLLKEGRKQNISLLLATQTTSGFSRKEKACINQAATKVYFRQTWEDAREIARSWSSSSKQQKKYEQDLTSLRVGRAIASGSFAVAGNRIQSGLVYINNYRPKKSSTSSFPQSRKPAQEHLADKQVSKHVVRPIYKADADSSAGTARINKATALSNSAGLNNINEGRRTKP